ncbi:hypothetical protein F4X86_02860 [Candidatus Saccharibacteria bacterium]|nr:hypothetical protein [Candidatus Saccharibacteria bacterium]
MREYLFHVFHHMAHLFAKGFHIPRLLLCQSQLLALQLPYRPFQPRQIFFHVFDGRFVVEHLELLDGRRDLVLQVEDAGVQVAQPALVLGLGFPPGFLHGFVELVDPFGRKFQLGHEQVDRVFHVLLADAEIVPPLGAVVGRVFLTRPTRRNAAQQRPVAFGAHDVALVRKLFLSDVLVLVARLFDVLDRDLAGRLLDNPPALVGPVECLDRYQPVKSAPQRPVARPFFHIDAGVDRPPDETPEMALGQRRTGPFADPPAPPAPVAHVVNFPGYFVVSILPGSPQLEHGFYIPGLFGMGYQDRPLAVGRVDSFAHITVRRHAHPVT